ncbi:hypothetical protein DXC14_14860 [Bacteroides sp. D20]|jgi:hypothetical protein|nr:hypothetical protein DXC14_14860 [Bacteroides sp. D20]
MVLAIRKGSGIKEEGKILRHNNPINFISSFILTFNKKYVATKHQSNIGKNHICPKPLTNP